MNDEPIIDATDLIKVLPKQVVEAAYNDVVRPGAEEAGEFFLDVVKTLRLALFPLQFASALQDRLHNFLSKAISKVPEARRVLPVPSLAMDIADRLKFQDDGSVIAGMYVELLARAMDAERVGEAHPAFLLYIGQLAPAEALLIEQLTGNLLRSFIKPSFEQYAPYLINSDQRTEFLGALQLDGETRRQLAKAMFRPELLPQPDLFPTYLDHLVNLGIFEYVNASQQETPNVRSLTPHIRHVYHIGLTRMGKLFQAACLASDGN